MAVPCAKRDEHPIKSARWIEFDTVTGEYIDSPVNEYGEDADGTLFGIQAKGRYFVTRLHRWEINLPKRAKAQLLSITTESWHTNLNRLTSYREASGDEVNALPADAAYAWEKRQVLAGVLPSLEFCQ